LQGKEFRGYVRGTRLALQENAPDRTRVSTMLIADHQTDVLIAPDRLTADTRLLFRRSALEHLDRAVQRSAARVVIDLGATREIDASGLGVLVLVQKRARERMIATTLLNAGAAVRQMLLLTKLDYLFEFAE